MLGHVKMSFQNHTQNQKYENVGVSNDLTQTEREKENIQALVRGQQAAK